MILTFHHYHLSTTQRVTGFYYTRGSQVGVNLLPGGTFYLSWGKFNDAEVTLLSFFLQR